MVPSGWGRDRGLGCGMGGGSGWGREGAGGVRDEGREVGHGRDVFW